MDQETVTTEELKDGQSSGMKKSVVIIYLVLFFAVWSLCVILLFKELEKSIENEVLYELVRSGFVKNLVWTLPALLLIRKYNPFLQVKLKEMFSFRLKWLEVLLIAVLFTLVIIVPQFIRKGGLHISESFGAASVVGLLFVGLTEELVFRGWLLNVSYLKDKHSLSIAVNTLFFLLIHFPVRIASGTFVSFFTTGGFVSILIVSWVFGEVFFRYRSLVPCILLHMYWDLLVMMFV